jgi:hypothetical protein
VDTLGGNVWPTTACPTVEIPRESVAAAVSSINRRLVISVPMMSAEPDSFYNLPSALVSSNRTGPIKPDGSSPFTVFVSSRA